MPYKLEGQLLEVCTCKAICPCWVGEDPDGGSCDGLVFWHIKKGDVGGVDVSGLSIGVLARIPGNVLAGDWRVVLYVDDRASPEQKDALLQVWSGKAGGPVADLVQLVGEVVTVTDARISVDVTEGRGRLTVGDEIEAELEPFQGGTGGSTTLSDAVFSTIPGSPAYVGKAPIYRARNADLGLDLKLSGHNSVQGHFLFEA